MQRVTIEDPLDASQVWYVRSDGSAEIKGADDTAPGIELCREDVANQAPVFLEMAWVAGLTRRGGHAGI